MRCYGQYTFWNEETKSNSIRFDIFLQYYYEHIQYKETWKNEDGTEIELPPPNPYKFFYEFFKGDIQNEMEYQKNLAEKLLGDVDIDRIQIELEKKGIQCCVLNMSYLCEYIKYLAKNRCFVLLNPTIKETLSELSDVTSITFTNKDGSTSTTKNSKVIEIIMEALNAQKDKMDGKYEAFKVVNWDKISNKEIIQAVFVKELTKFLHSYFPIKRKKGSILTTAEQELVLYFLGQMKLGPEKITKGRFRQLLGAYDKINFQTSLNLLPLGKDGKRTVLEFSFIDYSKWKPGRINFQDPNLRFDIVEKNDTISFSKDIEFDM